MRMSASNQVLRLSEVMHTITILMILVHVTCAQWPVASIFTDSKKHEEWEGGRWAILRRTLESPSEAQDNFIV